MDFYSAYGQGFARLAACTLHTAIGEPATNAESVLAVARDCHDEGVGLAVFPELTLSGYSIEDILMQDALLDAVEDALLDIVVASADLLPVLVVGAPLRYQHRIYNTAVVIHRGTVLGVVPKSYLPNYREFYERRQMAAGDDVRGAIRMGDADVPFGPDLLFTAADLPGFVLHVEICEDMFVPIPPSAQAALAGATVIANLSGSPITIGRAEDRCLLARSASSRCLAAYVYAAAGEGESTTDLAWDGQTMVWENGVCLAQSERFPKGARRSVADVDLELLRSERLRMGTFDDNRKHHAITAESFRRIEFRLDPPKGDIGLRREVERFPFVPSDPDRLEQDCYEAYNIQVAGLEQRLRALNYPEGGARSVGRSGLDACADRRRPRNGPRKPSAQRHSRVHTAGLRHRRAHQGQRDPARRGARRHVRRDRHQATAELMLKEMDHPFSRGEKVYDVTFENVQAGLRTDYLFRIANQRGGIVLGTGDLSELALGWSTYGVGDQMSHYNVNGGVPKTLIQHLIRWVVSSHQFDDRVNEVLMSVLDTEISPELVPTGEDEEIQSSEAKVGPYVLQDFSLFQVLRYGFRPSKVAFLAWHAWSDTERGDWPAGYPVDKRPAYSLKEIRHWLQVFVQRYYSFAQFKRSAMPNGPKVSHGGSLSPRGDWRAPSDMSAKTWLDEIEREVPED